jgi:hypothetical protein
VVIKIYSNILKNEFETSQSNLNSNFFFQSDFSENFVLNKLNTLDIKSNFVYHNKN